MSLPVPNGFIPGRRGGLHRDLTNGIGRPLPSGYDIHSSPWKIDGP